MEEEKSPNVCINKSGEGKSNSTWQDPCRFKIVTAHDPYPIKEDSDEDSDDSFIREDSLAPFGKNPRTNDQHWSRWDAIMKKSTKAKIVKWDNTRNKMTPEKLAKMFPVAEIKPSNENFKSSLSYLLENCPPLPHLEYRHFARHDGEGQFDLPIKCYKIFMTVAPEERRNVPYCISVTAESLIQDLIGLICYKYSIDYPDIGLGKVDEYGLVIADDNGEVDWAFPCFERYDACSKFGFVHLAFVDLKYKESISTPPIIISAVEEEKAAQQAAIKEKKTYYLELEQKLWFNIQVQMTVTYDKIELLDMEATPRIFNRKKITLQMDDVADCQLGATKNNKTSFRLAYCRSDTDTLVNALLLLAVSLPYRHHDFSCDDNTAKQVVEKINAILEVRNSPRYRKYKLQKMPKPTVDSPAI